MNLAWTGQGWEDYESWASGRRTDQKIVKRIHDLVREIRRDPAGGKGKPELLRGFASGYVSRRISDEHRLVYKVEDDQIIIIQCRGHY